uniref:ATP synthase subunit a n=1 Tax=Syrbatus sp. 2 RRMO-2024a TaxID=3154168 RepID=A0AAU7LKP6_9COLE
MMNLFMIFDPISNFMTNWMSMLFMFMMPLNYWFNLSRWNLLWIIFNTKMYNELTNFYLNKKIFFINLLTFIFFCNFISIFPYIFPSTSHLLFISLSAPLWLSFMIWGWFNNMNHMFLHLVPKETPFMLIPMMIYIEFLSNLARPLSLMIRLSANMTTGHLLILLMNKSNLNKMILFIFFQLLLLVLEFMVNFIQSYIFSMLTYMYSKEIE